MFSLIAFGVVAVIVVVFLLTFNVRSLSRGQSQPTQVEPSKEIETLKEKGHAPENNLAQTAERVTPPKNETSEPEKDPSKVRRESEAVLMLDKDYRNSLRQFRTQANPKSTEPVKPCRNDEEYRSALRSMAKPKE